MQKRRLSTSKVGINSTIFCVAILLFLSGCEDGGKSFRKALRGAAGNANSSRGLLSKPRKGKTKSKKDKVEGKKIVKSKHKDAIHLCPEDARLVGSTPPKGDLQWCAAKGDDGKAVRHGPYKKWHKNGKLKESGYFEMGQPHGDFIVKAPNGTVLQEKQFNQGKLHGVLAKYDKKGTQRLYATYHDGQKHGKYVKWTRNGQPRQQGSYYLDQQHGEWYNFHRDGQVRSLTTFYQGRKRGPVETYSKDGKLLAQGEYHDDQKVNRWVSFFRDGTIKSDGSYLDGQKHGQWTTYNKDGRVRKSAVYETGSLVQESVSALRARATRRRGSSKGKAFGSRDILGAPPPLPQSRTSVRQSSPATTPSAPDEGWEPL